MGAMKGNVTTASCRMTSTERFIVVNRFIQQESTASSRALLVCMKV
jgi:hypothetical protein